MGRPRKKGNEGLPDRVYRNAKRVFVKHVDGHETWLAPADANRDEIWRAYLALPTAPAITAAPPKAYLLDSLLEEFSTSRQFAKLAPGTQQDAMKAFRVVRAFPTKGGAPFGKTPVQLVVPVVMRGYMDKRGEQSETRADRELSYTSMAFSWGFERGKVDQNPCLGIRRFNPPPRTRYVTDEEYQQRYDLAGEFGRQDVQVAMEMLYLMRLREKELVAMRESGQFFTAEGVMARRVKRSKTQLIEWSPRLQAAVELARSIRRKTSSLCFLISAKSGIPLSQRALQGAWNELRKEAMKRGQAVDWTMHDLKAKGVSDFEGDKHKASGHKTQRMTAVYDRSLEKVDSTR